MESSMTAPRKPAAPRKAGARKAATLKTTRKTASRNTAGRAHPARKRPLVKKKSAKSSAKHWSQRATRESDALDLKSGVFTLSDPRRIAASLKRSAEHSSRRKTSAYRSALSMLTFYINRAGKTLPKTQRDRLQRAKAELKHQFHRE
jgi:putative cell wall-binding protein